MDAAQLIQATSEPLGKLGGIHYFDPAVLARGKTLALTGSASTSWAGPE